MTTDGEGAAARWQRIEALFQAALAQPEAERDALLNAACGDDDAMRQEVAALLAADRRAGHFMEEAVEAEAGTLHASGERARVGQQVGAYRLLRLLGRGGMSTVYLAARADEQFEQQVAVKLIKRGMDSEEIQRRFRQERQILANLEHPSIARLLDGGATADGLPYLVMEHIAGQPIDSYCDTHRLSITARLQLFCRVCAAVHVAHQSLVVHRDIKPGNILVTDDGTPKLLDFGIAKLLEPGDGPMTVVHTDRMARVMTPEYASPEQVRGAPITTASDVYSLGVLLYELLTGHRPYRFASRRPSEVERVITAVQPERPSTVIGRTEEAEGERPRLTPETVSASREGRPERLRRRLVGDLDNVVLMAMRKEPQRRYASVEQLRIDLERHLTGLPVTARRDTFRYRASKFVRRHRVGVAAAALVFVAVLASALVAIRQAQVATAEKASAEQVLTFVESLFEVADPNAPHAADRDITARELLDRGAERIASQLAAKPETSARLMRTMGRIYRGLGHYDEATALLEEALALRRGASGGTEAAATLNDLAMARREGGDREAAEHLFREALVHGRAAPDAAPQVATSLNGLGAVFLDRGEAADAEPLLREALTLRQTHLGVDHPDAVKTLLNLGSALVAQGELEAAEPLMREALQRGETVLGKDHPLVAVTRSNLARLLYTRLDYPGAETIYRQVLAQRQERLGTEHPDVARSLNNLAKVLYVQGRHAEAQPLFERALEIKRARLGADHPSLAATLAGLGMVLDALGDPAAAEPLLHRAVALRRAQLPPGHPALAEPLIGLGEVLTARGAAAQAEPLLREALEIRRNALPEDAWQIAEAENALGGCLASLGHNEEAAVLLDDSAPVLSTTLGADDPRRQRAAARRNTIDRK